MSKSEDTFHSRLMLLIQKSRKALRLYSNMEKRDSSSTDKFQDLQIAEWRVLNQDLLKHLLLAADNPSPKTVLMSVENLRDRFYSEWRMVEAELHNHHKALLAAAESGDFIKAALESSELVIMKAKMQAAQAAHHELEDLLQFSRINTSVQHPDLGNFEPWRRGNKTESEVANIDYGNANVYDQPLEETTTVKSAKIIPLRKRSGDR